MHFQRSETKLSTAVLEALVNARINFPLHVQTDQSKNKCPRRFAKSSSNFGTLKSFSCEYSPQNFFWFLSSLFSNNCFASLLSRTDFEYLSTVAGLRERIDAIFLYAIP